MTREDARAAYEAYLEKMREPSPEALAFEATYAHRMPLPKTGRTASEDVVMALRSFNLNGTRGREPRDSLRRTVSEWAEANDLYREADYDFHANRVGFKSADAAFWYKVALL